MHIEHSIAGSADIFSNGASAFDEAYIGRLGIETGLWAKVAKKRLCCER